MAAQGQPAQQDEEMMELGWEPPRVIPFPARERGHNIDQAWPDAIYRQEYRNFLEAERENFPQRLAELPCPKLEAWQFAYIGHLGNFGRKSFHQVRCKLTGHYGQFKQVAKDTIRESEIPGLIQEKKLLFNIASQFVVRAYGTLQTATQISLFVTFTKLGSIRRFKKREQIPASIFPIIAGQIVLALEYLHVVKIIHRALSQDNVYVYENYHVKLGGFKNAVREGDFLGPPCSTYFQAPESLNMVLPFGPSVDWWGLGTFLYELHFGKHPFGLLPNHCNARAAYGRIFSKNPEFPMLCPAPVRNLIESLLEFRAINRIGCFERGADDVKEHQYFSELNFIDLLRGRTSKIHLDAAPRVPYDRFPAVLLPFMYDRLTNWDYDRARDPNNIADY